MSHPLSWKDKMPAFFATAVLLTTGVRADKRDSFLYSSTCNSHISGISTLYILGKDTGWLSPAEERIPSRYVRKEKNSDLVIVVPVVRGKYKIRFFDDRDQFLFEIKQIRDSLLIVEKVNFRHAGLFQYELYKESALVERNLFIIKSNP
ncbi:MAG TPA: hypothetical protein VHC48_17125 [Puia sp.]|nr:hypothetical protein [Puia sp.]